MSKLGTKLDKSALSSATQGPPPVVFAAQVTSYLRLEKPEQLKQWEQDIQGFYGIHSKLPLMQGSASESCSGGCSDDCDLC
jgi:hypothetical protein